MGRGPRLFFREAENMARKVVSTDSPARKLWLAYFALVLSLLLVPLSGLALEECGIEHDPASKEDEELLEMLKNDPFAQAFGADMRALEEVVAEGERQERYARAWSNELCRPFVVRRDRYEADVARHNSRCNREISDQDSYQSCVRSMKELNRRKVALDAEWRRVESGQNRINSWAAEIVAKGKRPREHARFLLDPSNLDYALWLYATTMRREAPSDCAAMTKIMGALGRKVDSVAALVGWAGAIIGRTGNPFAYSSDRPEVALGSRGFKSEYADESNQVRHFVAYFSLGVKTPTMRLREFIASCRDQACEGSLCRSFLAMFGRGEECSLPDYKLGLVAAELGHRVAQDPRLMKNLEGYVFGAACR